MNFYSLLGVPYSARILAGFLLTGFLAACPGAFLPVWRYHIQTDYIIIGSFFLFFAIGLIGSVEATRRLRVITPYRKLLWIGCLMACAALLWLAFLPPFIPGVWRTTGFLFLGAATGLIHSALFNGLAALCERNAYATATVAGVLFGLGLFLSVALVANRFYSDSSSGILGATALFPAFFTGVYARGGFPAQSPIGAATISEALSEFRNPPALLLGLLMLFHVGNALAFGGWLPLFLIHRVGISPEASLLLLATFWFVSIASQVAAFRLIRNRVSARTLFLTAWAGLFGCLILLTTDNRFGAWTGILLTAGGFAALAPLIVERILDRFPDYHPGFYNGVFAFVLAGGMLFPAAVGFLADSLGIWAVAGVPLCGTAAVFTILLLIWFQKKFTRRRQLL